jgi:hypothetical protein
VSKLIRRILTGTIVLTGMGTFGAIGLKPAQAASISYSTSPAFSFDSKDPNGFSGNATLPYFDRALGELDNVILEWLGEVSTSISITNMSEESIRVAGSRNVQIESYLPDISNYGGFIRSFVEIDGLLPAHQIRTASNTNANFGGMDYGANDYFFNLFGIDSNTVDQFVGVGSFSVDFKVSAWRYLEVFVGDNDAVSFSVEAKSTASNIGQKITYYYTPVPTPALLPGLLAIAWKNRRKRKHQAIA